MTKMIERFKSFFQDRDNKIILKLLFILVLTILFAYFYETYKTMEISYTYVLVFNFVLALIVISTILKLFFALFFDINIHVAVYFLILSMYTAVRFYLDGVFKF